MSKNEQIITENNKINLPNNLNKLKESIEEILKELQVFNDYLNSYDELIQKLLYCIESIKNENKKSYDDYINIENLYKDKLIKEFEIMFEENERIYKMSNNSKNLLSSIVSNFDDSQNYEKENNLFENLEDINPNNSVEYQEKFSYINKSSIQNDSKNDDSYENNYDKKPVTKIKLIDEKTKLRNNLSEVIIAFKKCCNIIFDDSNISEFPVLNEFNNINKVVNHFYKICQLLTNNSINFDSYSEKTEGIEEILSVLSKNINDDSFNNIENSISYSKQDDSLLFYTDNNIFNNFDYNNNFPKIKMLEFSKNFYFIYSNDVVFNDLMKEKIINKPNANDIKFNNFELLFYSLRFCLDVKNNIDLNRNEYLYSQIISSDIEKNLSHICIPGNNHLDNIYINNYNYIKEHLIIEDKTYKYGVYICSCGVYYEICPNGFLNTSITCYNCGKKLEPSSQIKTPYLPNYYRIFKDNDQKNTANKKYNDLYKNVPNMLFEEYKKDRIDPILEANKFGIIKVDKIDFKNINIKIRNLSNIGYRILNFILYSYLFYANSLGFISNENIKNYTCDEMTCFDMLEIDWNILKDELRQKGILNIHIFMDIIFDNFYKKVMYCKKLQTLEERNKFEDECEKLLNDSFQKYFDYLKLYNKNI